MNSRARKIAWCFVLLSLFGCRPVAEGSISENQPADRSTNTISSLPEVTPTTLVRSAPTLSEPPITKVSSYAEKKTVHKITFDDLKLDIKKDTKFKASMLTEKVKKLEGEIVSVSGFIHPGSAFKPRGITEFYMIRNLQCKFGPGGQMHHNIHVTFEKGVSANYSTRPITVEGVLTIEPVSDETDGTTWTIYHLRGYKVK